MLTRIPFYHGIIRKTTVAFGALFNNILLVSNNSQRKAEKIITVPIQFANKDKYIVRLQQDPNTSKQKQITLPRLSFELTSYNYDTQRKLNKIHKIRSADGELFQYAPVPYVVNFSLTSYTKTTEDNLQIMEQIIPYFAPELTVRVKMIEKLDLSQDIPFVLQSVDTEDTYDGDFEETRMIMTTYLFSAKIHLYGPINGFLDGFENQNHFGNGENAPVIKRVMVNVNGEVAKYSAQIDPFEATIVDEYFVKEDWTELGVGIFDKLAPVPPGPMPSPTPFPSSPPLVG